MSNWIKRLLSWVLPGRRTAGEVAFEGEEGFVDLALPILEISDTTSGSVSILVQGSAPLGEVGFEIEVLPEWKQQDVDDGRLILYWGVIRYKSTGAASDRFLALLAQQYDLPAIDLSMKEFIEITTVGLNSDPRNLRTSRIDMKLFFDQEAEDAYAEFYTNVDIENNRIEFKEKDSEYRAHLVNGFARQR